MKALDSIRTQTGAETCSTNNRPRRNTPRSGDCEKCGLDKQGEKLVAPRQSFKERPRGDWEKAIGELAKASLVRRVSDIEVEFPDVESARFAKGIWLEEYAWHVLRDEKVFDVRMSARGAWERGPGARNEFDVLATHANQLLFIECKTLRYGGEGDKDSNTLYKVDSLGQDARGLFGVTWLLSALKPTDEMLDRARAQGVRILGPNDLPRLPDIVRQWMKP